MLSDFEPSRREAVLWLVVAVTATVIAQWRLAPRAWRLRNLLGHAFVAVTTYLALIFGYGSGFNEWVDHEVLERLRGGIDDIATWLVAIAGALMALAIMTAVWRVRDDDA